jgi:hypothetical protein
LTVGTTAQNTYQLAGLDPRERGFSRPVEVREDDQRYRASLRYEATRIVTAPGDTQEAALQLLVATLHEQGYRQLKTQITFRSGTYLGSRESWVEYPDPPLAGRRGAGLVAAICNWFHRDTLSA